MCQKQILCFMTCLFITFCESFSVDNLPKCSIKDSECQRDLYQTMVRDIGKHGVPELNIPAVDPIVLKNVSVSILNLVDLTMVDGEARGVKNCVFNKFEINADTGLGTQEVMCDITIKGHYSLSGDSPILKNIFGSSGIHGDGTGKVKLEKIFMTWQFPFYFEKRKDGEIYIICLYKDIEYNYDIKGRATFAGDSVYVGKENISEFVVNYMNENWKFLMKTFGKPFVDKAMEFYFDFAQKFFEGVPVRHYIIEDLTPYLKN